MPTTNSIPLPGRRRVRPTTLRRQFVAGGVALVALASIVIGIASSYAVGRTLVERLDEELADAARRVSASLEGQGQGSLNRPGFAVGTVVAVITDQEVSGAYIDRDGNLQPLGGHQVGLFARWSGTQGRPRLFVS